MTEPSPKTLKMPIGVVVEPPPSMVDTAPTLGALAAASPPSPPTLDLHGGKEPVTWAGASLELSGIGEHRPTSTLARDPQGQTWLRWAVGGTALVVLIVAGIAMKGRHAEAEPAPVEAAVELPQAVEEPLAAAPAPAPSEEPKAKAAKPKKSSATKREPTLAASSPASAKPSDGASKPASSTSTASKPASKSSAASKPTPTPTPTPAPAQSKPNLAPPDDDAKGGSAALPDISAWDDQDAAVGERSAAE